MWRIKKAFWVWRTQGFRKVVQLSTRQVKGRLGIWVTYPYQHLQVISAADPYDPASFPKPLKQARDSDRLTLRWYMPAPGRGSGGHLNLFRIIDQLTKRGHRTEVAMLDGAKSGRSRADMERFIKDDFYADVKVIWDTDPRSDVDIVLATTWQSAYTVAQDTACAARAYVVQDWEPDFHPRGSDSIFAENSYRLGLHHITAGPWLSERLRAMGAQATPFPFAADPLTYFPDPGPKDERAHIVFYARPVTPRRCFELGLEALRLLSDRLGPNRLLVSMAGWPIAKWPANYAVIRHGILAPGPLRRLYSSSDIVLVLSSTNPSLLPLEAGLCGVPVVDLALPSLAGTLEDGISARLAQPSPGAIARTLADLIEHPEEARALGARAREHALTCTWEAAGAAVEAGLRQALAEQSGRRRA